MPSKSTIKSSSASKQSAPQRPRLTARPSVGVLARPRLSAPLPSKAPPKPRALAKVPPVARSTRVSNDVEPVPTAGKQVAVRAGGKVSNTLERWLRERVPYLQSLRDPLSNPGVRIPDTAFSATSSFSLVLHGNVTASSSTGVAGVIIGSPLNILTTAMVPQYYLTCAINGGSVPGALGLQTNPAIATTTQPFTESNTLNAGSVPITSTVSGVFSGYMDQARVVSAVLTLRSTNSVTSQSGYFVGASLPRQFLLDANYTSLNSLTVAAVQNFPGALTAPVNGPKGENGISVFYSPTDSGSFDFVSTNLSSLSQSDPKAIAANPGGLVALVVGANSGTYVWDLCINYEAVLSSAAVGFGNRATVSDPIALAVSMNARPDDPLVVDNYNVWEKSGMAAPEVGAYLGDTQSLAVDIAAAVRSLPTNGCTRPTLAAPNVREHLIHHPTPLQAKRRTYESEEEIGTFESLATDVGRIADKIKMLLF